MTIVVDAKCCVAGSQSVSRDASHKASLPEPMPKDPLGRHLLQLMTLHSDRVKFRCDDLDKMDEPTKQALLEDMYSALEIEPLSSGM